MKDFCKRLAWIFFEISWPLVLGFVLLRGVPLGAGFFKDSHVFICVWVGIQSMSMMVPLILYVFDKISVLSVLVSGLWGGGVYAFILYHLILEWKEVLQSTTKHQILTGNLHFGTEEEIFLKLGVLFWSLGAFGGSFYVLKYALTSLKARNAPLKNSLKMRHTQEESSTHGSAILANRAEIDVLNQKEGIPVGCYSSKILKERDPFRLKEKLQTLKRGKILCLKVDHAVVIAPSGAGKGIGIIIPTLLDYRGPIFVTDIKGENYSITHKAREDMGHKVVCLDPFRITNAVFEGWNILDILRVESPTVIEDSAAISALLSPQKKSEGSNARYFAEQAARLIQCLMLYVSCSEDIPKEERNLVTVFDLLMQPIADLKEITLRCIESKKDLLDGIIAGLAARILGTEARELSGTLNTAAQELSFLQSPLMRKFFTEATFKGEKILDGKTDVYVCLPPEHRESYGRFMRLITGCIFLSMQKGVGKRENTRGDFQKRKLLMVLDEMPSLGYMSAIEDMIVYGRGYGVSVIVVSQTIELIKSTYPDSWRTFLSNHLALFFGCSDHETCQMVSDMLGKKTTLGFSYSEGQGNQKKSLEWRGSHSLQEGNSYGEVGRPLLTPDEVKMLGEGVVLGFLRGTRPLMIQRLNYLTHKEFKGRFLENPFYGDSFFKGKRRFLNIL